MPDYGEYFDLLARAIARRGADAADARQQIYEHARRAQSLQLQQLYPSVPETEIQRERDALGRAIERIEAAISEQPKIIEMWLTLLVPESTELSDGDHPIDNRRKLAQVFTRIAGLLSRIRLFRSGR